MSFVISCFSLIHFLLDSVNCVWEKKLVTFLLKVIKFHSWVWTKPKFKLWGFETHPLRGCKTHRDIWPHPLPMAGFFCEPCPAETDGEYYSSPGTLAWSARLTTCKDTWQNHQAQASSSCILEEAADLTAVGWWQSVRLKQKWWLPLLLRVWSRMR